MTTARPYPEMPRIVRFLFAALRSLRRRSPAAVMVRAQRVGGPPGGGDAADAGGDRHARREAGRADQRVRRLGEVAALATIQPQVEGFLTRIAVRSGQHVARARCCSRSTPRRSRRRSASLQSMRPMREADVEFARQQVERNKTLLRRGRHQPARSRAGRGAAARRRGAAEGARRADPPAAQRAGLLPRHRADRRHRRRHPGERRRSRHAIDGADHGRRERRARALHQRAGAAGAAAQGRAAGPARRRSRPGDRHQPDHLRVADRRHRDAVGAGEGAAGRRPRPFRTDQFVRARVVWTHRAGPDRAADRGDADQRAVLRVRRGEGRPGHGGAAEAGAARRDRRQRLRGAGRPEGRRAADRRRACRRSATARR